MILVGTMKTFTVDDVLYKVGGNASENTDLIKSCEGDWFWFHLDKFPSCHVVICSSIIDNKMILIAGELVKAHSKYKFKNIGVNYCKVQNLCHGADPGSVSFKSKRQVTTVYI